MEPYYYEVNLGWQYDRLGQLSAAGIPDPIEVATPPPFVMGRLGSWSPEHLLIGAVVSCYMTTFLAIAENAGLDVEDFECRAIGKLEESEEGLIISEIVLYPVLLIAHESDYEKASQVLTGANRHCVIKNSVKATVTMTSQINVIAREYD